MHARIYFAPSTNPLTYTPHPPRSLTSLSQNVPYLTPAELDEYEVLLKVETIDIYNYVSGKDVLPPYLADLGVMHKLQAYAKRGNMDSPEGYKKMKEDANLT